MQQQPQPPASAMQQYRELIVECQKIQGKISELEVDRAEHVLVEETLKPLDPKRRAFRLVGECLVERSVEEVLPTVAANRENVSLQLENSSRFLFVVNHVIAYVTFYCLSLNIV